MKQQGLSFFTDTHLTVLGLLIFFIFFVCMVVKVYRKSSKDFYEELAQIPLQEEKNHE